MPCASKAANGTAQVPPKAPRCLQSEALGANILQKTASQIPLDRLLIETDSPFLAPEPKRGSSNEPSFIKYTAEKLAKIKKVTYNEIIGYTSQNFIKLFSLNL